MFKSFFKKKNDQLPAEQNELAQTIDGKQEQLKPEVTEGETTFPLELYEEKKAEEQPSEPNATGFLGRLKIGLGKTRAAISDKVDAVLSSLGKIDEDLFEELEEALIMSDIGAETSAHIIEVLKEKAKAQGLSESSELKGLLCQIIADILATQDPALNLTGNPAVIMVIGVNGVGKTTTMSTKGEK